MAGAWVLTAQGTCKESAFLLFQAWLLEQSMQGHRVLCCPFLPSHVGDTRGDQAPLPFYL